MKWIKTGGRNSWWQCSKCGSLDGGRHKPAGICTCSHNIDQCACSSCAEKRRPATN